LKITKSRLLTFCVGFSQAVPLKFSLVRDLLRSGNQAPLQRVIDGVPDIFDF
jgi:hypothetical protein